MKFTHLRLSGFKSFVEPTELLIKDGLTGIVGPNGCGKSNLVEALTWVMGESSARNMRGGAMDDVIFAGTATRPQRNTAEVSLCLDNRARTAPASYNDTSELDVSRRIRRDSGSDYRINGKVARARDVQLLFADLATGAHSTAIVSQGRVGALINAKPTERRHLLEEAAGISGLYSRRHEAELRLNSAETNLERVDDVTEQLDAQLGNLKRQARQANRYRNISGHIRKAEAMLLYKKFQQATEKSIGTRAKYEIAVTAVNELTRQAAMAETAALKANEALKPLRDKEAAAAAAVHRLTLARENLDAEEKRAKQAKKQLEDRKTQISSDMMRERNLEKDAAEAVTRLDAEKLDLAATSKDDAPSIAKLQEDVNKLSAEVSELQTVFDRKTEAVAATSAEHNSLVQQIDVTTGQMERLAKRLADFEKEKIVLAAALNAIGDSPQSDRSMQDGIRNLEGLTAAYDDAETIRLDADQTERQTREKLKLAETEVTRLEAEQQALTRLLAAATEGEWPGIIEKLTVSAGYEVALGAALGDELEAPTDSNAPVYWSENGSDVAQELIHNLPTLDQFVAGHTALRARLSQIGIVATADGAKLQTQLKPGQRLVSRDGDL
ncbi:MAG: chromosome segregation protein SMC, partial [Sneathiella sp.]